MGEGYGRGVAPDGCEDSVVAGVGDDTMGEEIRKKEKNKMEKGKKTQRYD